MIIKLKQTGGQVRALGLELKLDGSELSAAEQRKLASLVKKAKLEDTTGKRSKVARDVRVIELTVVSEELSLKWKGDETCLPEAVEPLVDFIRTYGK